MSINDSTFLFKRKAFADSRKITSIMNTIVGYLNGPIYPQTFTPTEEKHVLGIRVEESVCLLMSISKG